MKKLALALLASLALSTGAQALETGVAPKVTELGVSNPTTGLYVGNSYSFIIAVAGAAGISPMAVVRRTWIPMIAGMITTIIANMIFFG